MTPSPSPPPWNRPWYRNNKKPPENISGGLVFLGGIVRQPRFWTRISSPKKGRISYSPSMREAIWGE